MSGYHPDTGIFELTATKAAYWLRRTTFPETCRGKTGMEFYAALFESFGYQVPKMGSNHLHVRATPGQVWEALSGKPSDPEHEKHYTRNPAAGSKSAPPPRPEGVRRLPETALKMFRAGTDGSGSPVTEATASGLSACRICGKPIAKGSRCLQGGYDFAHGPKGRRPTKCFVHLECMNAASS